MHVVNKGKEESGCLAVAEGVSGLLATCSEPCYRPSMKYVYVLQSEIETERFYVGSTTDLKRRFSEHNSGNSIHTNKYKPWKLRIYTAFDDHQKADEFEAYLKSGNGRQFARKHF